MIGPCRIIAAGAIILIAYAGCAGSKSAEERSPGEMAFRANCQTCHRLPKADFKTDEEWPAIVERYGARAKLDEATRSSILAYLQRANNE